MKTNLSRAMVWLMCLASITSTAGLVEQYWPMHTGDNKYYSGTGGKIYTRLIENSFYVPPRFSLDVYEFDSEAQDYFLSFTGAFGYSGDTVLEYGIEMGWNDYNWDPPLPVLDEASLANGGTRTFQSVVRVPGDDISVTVTFKVTMAGTVVVPAGTFNQCRSVSVTARLAGTSTVVANEAWVLAPKVGQIKIGVINEAGAVIGYQQLTSGTVGGVDVRDLANQIPPTLTITSPVAGQRISNAVATVTGTAKDNTRVTEVWYQINGSTWTLAQTVNGWTNWTATVNLVPGTNTVKAYAVDPMDNQSTIQSSTFIYVLAGPLIVGINGKGTINPNYNGKPLEIGKVHSMTATPAVGYAFSNWTDAVGTVITNKALLSFIMQSNLVFNANFVDIQKPVVTLTSPTLNQRWSNEVFTVAGKATDNGQVAQVSYQLNNGEWSSASTANGWSNWTASLMLTPGPNTVRAYAVDATGNRSTTNTVTMTYVLSGPLVVGINGKGAINPNYNGKLLEIGKVHSITATPAVGYAFSNWTDAVGMVITNKAMLSFIMQSNLVFNANFVDIQKPVVTITAPTLNQRWSNAVFTVAGKATDNGAVEQVLYQLNSGDWTSASTANAWSNWTASVTLTPGPSTVRAYAVDARGNRSTTNTVNMTYVLSGPLVVGINGKGTINPIYNGKLLEIGKAHSMTATPAVGYAFSNWTDAVGTVITNKALFSFIMQSNLVFNANFVDIQRPVVTITVPTLNQRWSNAVFTVAGKATDNGAVAQVLYQFNSGDWITAATANAWSNWSASVTLTPGPNTVRAYAVDATGNRSTTNTVNMTYVLSGPLVVGINGKGTINPNHNGKLLEIGKVHTMTATPAVGYAFSNWTDAVGTVITNKALLSFIMQSNLVFNANFVDIQKPVVTITTPTLNQRWSNSVFAVAGKATDNGQVAQVSFQLNSGEWTSASTANVWSNWTVSVTLTPGPNTVRAYAIDATGNRSTTNTVNMTYVLSGPLVVGINGKGMINPNYNGKLLEIDKVHRMTATPAVGYAFSNWTDAVGTVITNKAMLSFIMQSNLVFNANFVDIQKPVVTITAPTLNQRWSNAVFTVAGRATDNGAVAQVHYRLNDGDWNTATTANAWSNWTASVSLTPGPNTVRAYAVDTTGNRSTTNTVSFTYFMTYALVEYFHPLSVGNQWVYRFTHHSASPTNSVIRIDSVSHPLTCYRGRSVPTPYVTNVISLYSSYCDYHNGAEVFVEDTWYEYYTTNGGLRMWGSDDDPGTIPDPDQERLRVDGGVLLGERLAVGQTTSTTRDLYEDGEFMGAAVFSAQLVAQTNVTVPAGTFPDCLHIRITLSINGAPSSFEEWWAKGIGMVMKTRTSSGGYPQLYELAAYRIAAPAPAASEKQSLLLQLERDQRGVAVASGFLQMRLTGALGAMVVVESSVDLQRWVPIQTNTITADGLSLSVPMNQFPQEFFRARIP